MQETEEEFQFLLCERCQKESTNPKLLGCLHTLCLECLEESKPIGQCPICRFPVQSADGVAFRDNVLFASLQAKLNTYRKIASGTDMVCDHCKDQAHFWCVECSEFLCLKCYKAHQWYLKQKSHEPQRLADLKNDTAWNFLEGTRKSSNLLCSEHSQVLSVYCRGCQKPLCCSCAMLDSEHYNAKLYSNIRAEIERRKEELGRMKRDLEERKHGCRSACSTIQERLRQLEQEHDEVRAHVREQVEEMVRYVQQRGQELLQRAEWEHLQKCADVKRKLHGTERVMKRMESGETLVEKMNLFASDQEMIEMHPFVVESLEELKRQKLPSGGLRIPAGNFAEIRDEIRSLFRRVKGSADAASRVACVTLPAAAGTNSEHRDESRPRSQGTMGVASTPVKQQAEKFVQASPRMPKLESHDHDNQDGSSTHTQEAAEVSWRSPARELVEVLDNSPSGVCESDAATHAATVPTPASPVMNSEVMPDGNNRPRAQGATAVKSTPVKRRVEKFVQASPKMPKLESRDGDNQDGSNRPTQEGAAASWRSPARTSTPDKEQREPVNLVEVLDNSPAGVCESEVTSIVISSSEENEDDM
uniref:Protein PML-like n=1 Tax=Salvator merianae TaxID=96440 RepID=A0A8D0KNS9_SALMN